MLAALAIAAITVVAGFSGPAAASSPGGVGACYTADEVRAAQVRQLQTDLMVATLSCSTYNSVGLRDQYTDFIGRFGGSLHSNAEVLRAHFRRNHGRDHARRFDAYITALANEASVRSFDDPAYCGTAAGLFDTLSALSPQEIEAFAAAAIPAESAVYPCR